jgi:segregation and condensation protein A
LRTFRIDLESYNGPLDLLLYLIRREEVDVYDIPISRITEQYLGYVRLLQSIDPNLAGEFLVMAATLMEIKSRTLLPKPPPEEDDSEPIDPRVELVRQLLAYKTFKDAARSLDAAAQMQALKYPRRPANLTTVPDETDLEDAEIWDLFEAFNRLLEATGRRLQTHDVVYDDTPIALHAEDLVDSLRRSQGSQMFEQIFEGRNKSELIGLFLALLELIRQRRVRVEQQAAFGAIAIHLMDDSPLGPESFETGPSTIEPSAPETSQVEMPRPNPDHSEWGNPQPDNPGHHGNPEAADDQ